MPVLSILPSNFYYHYRVSLMATIFWDPADPGQNAVANMTGKRSDGVDWVTINGGVAFVHVIRGDGASLRIETWGTDARDMTAASIDIFTLPIDLRRPFPPAFNGLQIVSPHKIWTYVLTAIPGNPNGFNLTAPASSGPPEAPSALKVDV